MEFLQPPPLSREEARYAFSLLEGISPQSHMRAIAEQVIANAEPSPDTFPTLRQALVSPYRYQWRESRLAAWCLAHTTLSPHQRALAVQTLAEVVARRYDPSFGSIVKRAAILSSIFGVILGAAFSVIGFFSAFFFSYPIVHLFVWDAARTHAAQIRMEAARALQTLRAVEALDVLTVAAVNDVVSGRLAARSALCHLLPLLTPAHYGTLKPQTLHLLAYLLAAHDERLALSILDAFAKVGTRNVLSRIKLIAQGHGPYSHLPHVRQAAMEAQMRIEERLRREKETRVLLRPSQPETTKSEHLLRPATTTYDISPEALLRSAQPIVPPLDSDLVLVIIADLKQRSNPHAIPWLQALLQLPSLSPAVATAAQECISFLQARVELDRAVPPTLSSNTETELSKTNQPLQNF